MAHIFFIDPLEKLNIKKDSTLMMALTFQECGKECYLMFEKEFYVTNQKDSTLKLFQFKGKFKDDDCYLDSLELTEDILYSISDKDTIHMRIDPPYDTRYQRYLWMLDLLQSKTKCEVLNNPLKIMKYNEKLVAYRDLRHSHLSFIGSSEVGFTEFCETLKAEGYDELILKPLDLYSGIGVEKISLTANNLMERFNAKIKEFHGAIVAQPFIKDIYNGEYRSIYFDGAEVGTIIKKPSDGEFLANIAQGAKFEKSPLPDTIKGICNNLARELYEDGVRFIAFDILGDGINEVNITCPGLLVEVSYAYEKNLCRSIVNQF